MMTILTIVQAALVCTPLRNLKAMMAIGYYIAVKSVLKNPTEIEFQYNLLQIVNNVKRKLLSTPKGRILD